MPPNKVLASSLIKQVSNRGVSIDVKYATRTESRTRVQLAQKMKDDFVKAVEAADVPANAKAAIMAGVSLQVPQNHVDLKMEKEVFDILVDWNCDEKGAKTVTSVALGDFDIAFKLQEGALLHTPHTIGNAMWRSPKGQTGRGITKASDIFSFGLVCIYALGAGEVLLINNYQELLQLGMTAEQEILVRHLSYFGPVNQGLLKQINDGKWATALSSAPQLAELDVADRPELSFEQWGQELGSGAQDLIAGMTRIDPTARATIYQVLAHKWWHEEG